VFAAGTLTASADRRCPAPALGAVPDDALPRNSYTAPATASARTPPRTTQLSRVRITFKVTSATRKRVQPAAALQQTGGLLASVDGRRPAPRCPREKRREKNVHARRDAGGTEHAQVPAVIPVRREKRVRSDHLQRCDSTMKRGTVGLLARPYRVLPRSREPRMTAEPAAFLRYSIQPRESHGCLGSQSRIETVLSDSSSKSSGERPE
jgi:hypothetical protein